MYEDFNFNLLNDESFKEDAVREEIVNPLLKKLGYKPFGEHRINYSKHLQHPFVNIATKTKKIICIPDYLLEIDGKYRWVLDAKSPTETITTGENREQAYSYAIHPDIKVRYYALCNGREFILFEITEETPMLYFNLSEIDKHWSKLEEFLSPHAFKNKPKQEPSEVKLSEFDYASRPILPEIIVKKQQAKRHFGVHGYFTKQSWNVVQEYIRNYTKPGDLVLDPFGGSGVTLVEALMIGRKGVHIDINPMSVFIVDALVSPVKITKLCESFVELTNKFLENRPTSQSQIESFLEKYSFPHGIKLPKGSDVAVIDDLFSQIQLAQLAYLKYLINEIKEESIRKSLLLAFSSTITKFNKTYHSSTSRGDNAGDSAAFRYYRYRLAPEPVNLDLFQVFETKFKKLLAAKREIQSVIPANKIAETLILKGSANKLPLENESVDYIYTDPPYGSNIPYLDLSVMWNSWLDLKVTEEDYNNEAIEGGKNNKTQEEYSNLIESSLREMYRVLKFNRWLSFVFAHKDPKYWHMIVSAAEKIGFEYAGVVKQSNGQTSFKKRQNPFSVLSGQLIINFRKVNSPTAIQKIKLGVDIFSILIETIESTIAHYEGATLEQINEVLITKGLELGFLDILSKEYRDLSPILFEHFDYDNTADKFHIRKNKKFKTHINVHVRIRYFLISYLRRKKFEKIYPSTDQIILDIMPLLKNGTTPENQTILNVLETVADKIETDKWVIREVEQLNMFY
jgi:16S rRNA G966 N2-methylase RsmD